MNNQDLRGFLKGLPDPVREIVLALRDVVRQNAPHAEESLLWGGLSYHRPGIGGRVKGAVCQIVTRGGRIRLDFIHGIRLADPRGVLQGDRVSKRFVPVDSAAKAGRPEIAALIREAAALDPATWT
jgi:hypothetical protein